MKFQKKRKPVTKKIWALLRYLPGFVRRRLIRSRFDINYNLSSDYTFKLAETEGEIEAALRIVHDAYSHLGYIDEHPDRMHLNAYLCSPTTSILVMKFKEEVVGTMSLISDSPLGLPSDVTWDLDHVKSSTKRIAEVSSLTIRKSHKSSRGHLLLTLCKLIYEYGVNVLKLDGVVMAATLEVEPFYTDVMLFQRIAKTTGQAHSSVKGNRSTSCFLDFNKVEKEYVKVYSKKQKSKNLYHFFKHFNSPNIQLPDPTLTVQGLLAKKNVALVNVLKRFPSLRAMFSPGELQMLVNLDPANNFEATLKLSANENLRAAPRISVRDIDAHLYHGISDEMFGAVLLDASENGFGLKLSGAPEACGAGDSCLVVFKCENEIFSVRAVVQWSDSLTFGFAVVERSTEDWQHFVEKLYGELNVAEAPAQEAPSQSIAHSAKPQ